MSLPLDIRNFLLRLCNPCRTSFARIAALNLATERRLVVIQASFFAVGNEIIAVPFPFANFAATIACSIVDVINLRDSAIFAIFSNVVKHLIRVVSASGKITL